MYSILQKSRFRAGKYRQIFIAALLLAFHYYLVTYINSTYLEHYVEKDIIGLFYALGSTVTILIFLTVPPIIKKYGLYKFLIIITLIEISALLTLGFSKIALFAIIAFTIYVGINPVMLESLDVYLEDDSDIAVIGRVRGTFLTILSIAAIVSPLAIGSLVSDDTFTPIYLFSAFFATIFLLYVVLNFKTRSFGEFREIKLFRELNEFWKDKNIRHIGICYATLQFFYTWLVIYVPIYLTEYMGFPWSKTAIIISISLIPFLLFEIPVGTRADGEGNEKKMIAIGFALITVALLLFSIIPPGSFLLWSAVLFLARSGASIVEPSSDSYFFKKSKGRDELISIYRMATPLASITASLCGSILLAFLPLGSIFPILAAITFSGFLISQLLKKKDIS